MTAFRTAYGPKERSTIDFLDEEGNQAIGKTKQSFKDECDIHNIIRRYDKTGLITHVQSSVAQYGDFSEVNEYREALDVVIHAQNAFQELPAHIRDRFNHDPGKFFEFATDPDNMEEMVKMGLAEKQVQVKNDPLEVVIKEPEQGENTSD